jgi:hypothetical protein
MITAATCVSRDFQNGPGVGLQAHTAFSGVSMRAHRAVFVDAAFFVTYTYISILCTVNEFNLRFDKLLLMSSRKSRVYSLDGKVLNLFLPTY